MSGETHLLPIQQVALEDRVVASPLYQTDIGRAFLSRAIEHFAQGDWGSLPEDIWQNNDERLMGGGTIVGYYPWGEEVEFAFDLVAVLSDMELVDSIVIVHQQQEPVVAVMFQDTFIKWSQQAQEQEEE